MWLTKALAVVVGYTRVHGLKRREATEGAEETSDDTPMQKAAKNNKQIAKFKEDAQKLLGETLHEAMSDIAMVGAGFDLERQTLPDLDENVFKKESEASLKIAKDIRDDLKDQDVDLYAVLQELKGPVGALHSGLKANVAEFDLSRIGTTSNGVVVDAWKKKADKQVEDLKSFAATFKDTALGLKSGEGTAGRKLKAKLDEIEAIAQKLMDKAATLDQKFKPIKDKVEAFKAAAGRFDRLKSLVKQQVREKFLKLYTEATNLGAEVVEEAPKFKATISSLVVYTVLGYSLKGNAIAGKLTAVGGSDNGNDEQKCRGSLGNNVDAVIATYDKQIQRCQLYRQQSANWLELPRDGKREQNANFILLSKKVIPCTTQYCM